MNLQWENHNLLLPKRSVEKYKLCFQVTSVLNELITRRPSWCQCPRDFGWSTHPILATFLRWSSSSSRQSVLSWRTSPCCRSLDCLCQTMTRCHACDGFRCRGGHQESAPGNCHEPFLIECSLIAVAKISTSVIFSVIDIRVKTKNNWSWNSSHLFLCQLIYLELCEVVAKIFWHILDDCDEVLFHLLIPDHLEVWVVAVLQSILEIFENMGLDNYGAKNHSSIHWEKPSVFVQRYWQTGQLMFTQQMTLPFSFITFRWYQ